MGQMTRQAENYISKLYGNMATISGVDESGNHFVTHSSGSTSMLTAQVLADSINTTNLVNSRLVKDGNSIPTSQHELNAVLEAEFYRKLNNPAVESLPSD